MGVLLAGIVFFNVDLLQMNREITKMADRAAELKRANGRLRTDVARLASSERIQETAAGLGLVLPAPGDVRYLKSHPLIDPKNASKRMTAPNFSYVAPAPVTTLPEPVTDPTVTDPTATTDPTAVTDPATDPAVTDPTAVPDPTTVPTVPGTVE